MRVWSATALLGCLISTTAGEEYAEPKITGRDRSHWAFQAIQKSPSQNGIDALVIHKLNEIGVESLAPRAGRETLLRRLYFDLIGLPPKPEEITKFEKAWDINPDKAINLTIAELLARPQYGERWAQHWLDVARFSETDGFEHDKVRPESWRYRDWVISALNRDLPYDRFVALQIAADEIAADKPEEKAATGFLYCGPDMPDINLEAERRHTVLNETASSIGSTFLGLSMGCAQCHDHKSDPVSQADFYRLRAFFDNAKLPKRNKSLPHFFSESGREVLSPSQLRIRGDFRRNGPELTPAFLRIANPGGNAATFLPTSESSGRRTALANWLCDPKNPLVARVMVNRVWQHHFGRGLVATPNDFGKLGARATHPDLLDWLAADLMEHGWSLKHLHRRILLSQSWQQISRNSGNDPHWEKRLQNDPDGRFLSRRTPIRLSGEVIRDAMLQITNRLNLKPGGPGFRPPLPEEVTVTLLKNQWPVTKDVSEHDRRSIYLFARRNLRYPLFEVFDRPDGNLSCARRHVSTTAPQSLMLLNSGFSYRCAKGLAAQADIEKIFLLVLGRNPSDKELKQSRIFIDQQSREAFALAMFNLNEFVFLD